MPLQPFVEVGGGYTWVDLWIERLMYGIGATTFGFP
jgi:hypothetical protein